MGSGSPEQADSHRESSERIYVHVTCYSSTAFSRGPFCLHRLFLAIVSSSHGSLIIRPSALGLLLLRRRAREVLRSVHVHEPSSLLTFDLMGISMWMSMDISMWMSMDVSMWVSMDISI